MDLVVYWVKVSWTVTEVEWTEAVELSAEEVELSAETEIAIPTVEMATVCLTEVLLAAVEVTEKTARRWMYKKMEMYEVLIKNK